jgi:hypothetical protein
MIITFKICTWALIFRWCWWVAADEESAQHMKEIDGRYPLAGVSLKLKWGAGEPADTPEPPLPPDEPAPMPPEQEPPL